MKKLRAYMVWAGPYSEDGAVLAWAYNRQQARVIASKFDWMDCYDFIEVRARWLRNCTHEPSCDEPHVVQPPVCESCELWYETPLSDDGFCRDCQEAVEMEMAG